jgi:hypothetical protein
MNAGLHAMLPFQIARALSKPGSPGLIKSPVKVENASVAWSIAMFSPMSSGGYAGKCRGRRRRRL